MKFAIKLALGSLALASGAAFAGPITSTTDLIVLVTDQSTSSAYAYDTGIALSSITSSTGPSSINGGSGLAAFLAGTSAGDTVIWSIESGTAHQVSYSTGNMSLLVAGDVNTPPNFSNVTNSALGTAVGTASTVWNGFAAAINTDTPTGNTNSLVGLGLGTNNSTKSFIGNTTPSSVTLGDAANLYLISTNGTTAGGKVSEIESTQTYTLEQNGTFVVSGGTSPVPLPASAWLLGSALLGFVGVSRRRLAA